MNKKNNENENIDYKKQIDELNDKINKLTDTMELFQNTLEKISTEKNNVTQGQNKSMFDSKTGDRIIYNDEIYENIQEYKVDNITHESGNGKTDNIRYNIKQNELSFLKNKKNSIGAIAGAILGTTLIPEMGTALGGLIGSAIGKKEVKEENRDFIDKRRMFLENNPIKNYEEFFERIKAIDPNVRDEDLENIKKDKSKDIDYCNKLILDVYDRIQDLENYKLAKEIVKHEDSNFKYGMPYVKTDFTTYNLNNNLKKIMKDRNISQEQLAELINVSRSTIIQILNNKGTSLENAYKISRTLGISIDDIFNYELILDTIIKIQTELNNQDK